MSRDHLADALRYAMLAATGLDQELMAAKKRERMKAAHPEWTEEQLDAHLALHEPPPIKFRRYPSA